MKLVNPNVEYWKETNPTEHIARCAAICYKSSNYDSKKMIASLIKNGHLSMFRHASRYYIVSYKSTAGIKLNDYATLCKTFGFNPFFAIHFGKNAIYVSTNEQFLMEHELFKQLLEQYEVSAEQFAESTEDKSLLRFTFVCTTSIKVSRELNRVSPNNIAEQSTRYVNFNNKDGDVSICQSLEVHLTAVDIAIIRESISESCETYKSLVSSGVKPEDARRVLPLDTATRMAYTYNLREWKNILALRFFEVTGKAAPDAKLVAGMIYDQIYKLGYRKYVTINNN